MASLLELEEKGAVQAGGTAGRFVPQLRFPPEVSTPSAPSGSLLDDPDDTITPTQRIPIPGTAEPPADVGMTFRLTGPGSLTEKPAEKFAAGMELTSKGFKSMMKLPGAKEVFGLPSVIYDAWGGDPEKAGLEVPEPEQILPELPEGTPQSLRPFLEYVRSTVDPFVGAAAATVGPPLAVANAVSEMIVEQPVRTAIRGTLNKFKENPDSVPTFALVPLAVYVLKEAGYSLTDKDIDAIAESGSTLAGVLTGIGIGNALMKAASPTARMVGRMLGGEPEKPVVEIATGQAPMLPKPGKVASAVKKFLMPRHMQTPEFNQMYNEMAGRRLLGSMQTRKVLTDMEGVLKGVAKETGASLDDLRLDTWKALGGEQINLHPRSEAAMRPVREQINKWQQAAADVGLIGQEIVDESLGQYLYRGYLSKLMPGTYVPSAEALKEARAFLKDDLRIPVGRYDPARAAESYIVEGTRRAMLSELRRFIRQGRPDTEFAEAVLAPLKQEVLGTTKVHVSNIRDLLRGKAGKVKETIEETVEEGVAGAVKPVSDISGPARKLREVVVGAMKTRGFSEAEAENALNRIISAQGTGTSAEGAKEVTRTITRTVTLEAGGAARSAEAVREANAILNNIQRAFSGAREAIKQARRDRLTKKEVADLERDFMERLEKATGKGPVSFRRATPDEVEGAIERILGGDETFQFHVQQGGRSARVNMGPFTRRQDIPEKIRDLMGEIKDGPTAAALTISNLSRAVATKRFLDSFAKGSEIIEFGQMKQRVPWVMPTRVPGYVKVEGKSWGPLDGKFVLEKYADDLKGLVDEMSPGGAFWKWQAHAMNFFKVSKTVVNPATHLRNMLGNAMFADYAGVPMWDLRNSKYYMQAANELLTSGQGFTAKGVRAAKGGGNVGVEGVTPLVREAIENGAISTEMFGSEVFRETMQIYAKQHPAKAMWESAKQPIKAAGRTYNAQDQLTKLAAYIKRRRLGDSPSEAGLHVRNWTPNYRDVSPAVELSRSSLAGAPFATFYSEALRINARAAREHPIKFAKWIMMGPAMADASVSALGIAKEQWDGIRKSLPSYMDQPLTVLMPWRDGDGNFEIVDFTYIHPLGNLFAARRQGLDVPFLGDLALNNPILNTALEIAQDHNAFTRQESRKPGQPLAAWIVEVLNRNFAPPWTPAGLVSEDIESAPIAREIGRAIQRSRGEQAPGRFGQSLPMQRVLMNELGPIRILPVDENMMLTALQEKRGELNKLARGLSALGTAAAKGRISMDTVQERAERIMRDMRKLWGIRQRDWKAPRSAPDRTGDGSLLR